MTVANHQQIALLLKGVEAWNQWRRGNPYVTPVLRGANLSLSSHIMLFSSRSKAIMTSGRWL